MGSPESLVRLNVTGSTAPSTKEAVVMNLVGTSNRLDLFISDSPTSTNTKRLFLTGSLVNVFDKEELI